MAQAGAKNRQGEPGKPGEPGKDAVQPKFAIGEVLVGDDAKVWLTGTLLKPVLNFILPRGKKGDPGEPGKPGKPGAPGTNRVFGGDIFAAGSGSTGSNDDHHSGFSVIDEPTIVAAKKQMINFTVLDINNDLTLEGDLWLA